MSVRGVLHVHCAPPALCPHIEWAVAGVLGVPVSLLWVDQPASPGSLRAELTWQGKPGAAGAITSALASWNLVRFEVTESLRDRHGPRHPALGGSLEAELSLLLGEPWDDELEPFRRAGDGAPVRWLNATG